MTSAERMEQEQKAINRSFEKFREAFTGVRQAAQESRGDYYAISTQLANTRSKLERANREIDELKSLVFRVCCRNIENLEELQALTDNRGSDD